MGAKGFVEKVKDTFSDLIEVPGGVWVFSLFLFDQNRQWESEKRAVFTDSGRFLKGGATCILQRGLARGQAGSQQEWQGSESTGDRPSDSSVFIWLLEGKGGTQVARDEGFGQPLSLIPSLFGSPKRVPVLLKRMQSICLHCCLQATGEDEELLEDGISRTSYRLCMSVR